MRWGEFLSDGKLGDRGAGGAFGRGRLGRRVRTVRVLELTLLVALLATPLFAGEFGTLFVTRLLILSLFALSFDLTWGYGGIFSFGQALFFGVGAYAVGLLATRQEVTSIFVALPVATLAGFVLACAVAAGLLLGKRQLSLVYVALATLTGAYAAERLAAGWAEIGAANGIPSVPYATALGATLQGPIFYYLVFALLVAVYAALRYLVRSQAGLALAGIREGEQRVSFFGYRTGRLKVLVFSLAGAIAGLSGGLYASNEGFVGPTLLGVVLSTQVVLYALLGGSGTLIGPVIGVFAIEFGGFGLSQSYPEVWPVILGGALLLVVMFLPNGLIGLVIRDRERVGSFGRRAPTKGGAERQQMEVKNEST